MLVPLPIGLLVTALLADRGFALTGDPFWSRAAFWLLGGGIATASVAAVFGRIDFVGIAHARRHMIGWLHAIGNPSAVALAVVNVAIRWGGPEMAAFPWGLALSLVTVMVLVATGWAGGELVFRHRVGVMAAEADRHVAEARQVDPPRRDAA